MPTTIEIHEMILKSKAFMEGKTHTDFLDEHLDEWLQQTEGIPDEAFVAAALAEVMGDKRKTGAAASPAAAASPWQYVGKWEIGGGA